MGKIIVINTFNDYYDAAEKIKSLEIKRSISYRWLIISIFVVCGLINYF